MSGWHVLVETNGYQISDNVRECYIDGCWNKEKEDDYLNDSD